MTLSDELEKRQERRHREPGMIDPAMAGAAWRQHILDIMDDKHLALEGQIQALHRELRDFHLWAAYPSWFTRMRRLIATKWRAWRATEEEYD